MENRQTRNRIEARSGEIEIVTDTNHVGIGVVRVNDRICVGVVSREDR
jgi:hypothetical protein